MIICHLKSSSLLYNIAYEKILASILGASVAPNMSKVPCTHWLAAAIEPMDLASTNCSSSFLFSIEFVQIAKS